MSNIYKKTALDALHGNWKTAMKTGFIASLLGGINTGSSFDAGRSSDISDMISSEPAQEFFSGVSWQHMHSFVLMLTVILVVWAIVCTIVGGAVRLGYAKYNLNLIDRKPAAFGDLFSQMNRKWTGFCMNFFVGLYTALWSLLLVIPGIVKTFSYAMTPYILAENPEMRASDAITDSIALMDGHKWDLFCLTLSFFGWGILATAPALIVIIYVTYSATIGAMSFGGMMCGFVLAFILQMICYIPYLPYREAATAAFYRELVPQNPEEAATIWYQPV